MPSRSNTLHHPCRGHFMTGPGRWAMSLSLGCGPFCRWPDCVNRGECPNAVPLALFSTYLLNSSFIAAENDFLLYHPGNCPYYGFMSPYFISFLGITLSRLYIIRPPDTLWLANDFDVWCCNGIGGRAVGIEAYVPRRYGCSHSCSNNSSNTTYKQFMQDILFTFIFFLIGS